MRDSGSTQLYRKMWSKLIPGTEADRYDKIASKKDKGKSKTRSLGDQQKNLEKVKKIIQKRLGRKTQRMYIRNPVSSIRSLSARKQSGKSSVKRSVKPWYSDGFPEFRAANEAHSKRTRTFMDEKASSSSATNRGKLRRRKSIYFDEDGDEVPYYRSKSVNSSRRESTFKPVINEQDVVHKTYTGRDSKTPKRPSSLPDIRSRRNSTPVQKRIQHIPPHQRRSYSVGKLQADVYRDVNKLYADTATGLKQRQFNSQLSKLPMQHYSVRYMKLDPGEKEKLSDAFRNIERLKQLSSKFENNIKNQYFAKRNSSDLIGAKFDKLQRNKSEATPTYLQNRSFTKMKLDPIEKPPDTVRRRRSEKNIKRNTRPDISTKTKYGDKHGDKEKETESDYGTADRTDYSTIETLSTAVMGNTPEPQIDGKQGNEIRPLKRTKNRAIKVNEGKKIDVAHESNEAVNKVSVSIEQQSKAGSSDSTMKISSGGIPEYKTIGDTQNEGTSVSLPGPGIDVNKTKSISTSTNGIKNVSETISVKTNEGRVIEGAIDAEPLAKSSQNSARTDLDERKLSCTEFHAQESITVNEEETRQEKYQSNKTPENNAEDHSSKIMQHKQLYLQSTKGNKTTANEDHDQTKETHNNIKSFVTKETDKNQDRNNDDNSPRDPIVTQRRINGRMMSYDVVVDRDEYERRGHKVAEENIHRKSLMNISPSQNLNHQVLVEPKTNRSVSETEDENENVHTTIRRTGGQSINGPISWKEIAKNHLEQQRQTVVTDKDTTVQETEEVLGNDARGPKQWRDLVNKYLNQPNPKIGKSADRTLLETHESDDDDDDTDIFERAKRKYRLDVDSDCSEG